MNGAAGRLVAAAYIGVTVAVGGWVAVDAVRDPGPDPSAYAQAVADGVDGWSDSRMPGRPARDRAWVEAHPDAVMAEGRRACTWLEGQPDAQDVDPTGHRGDFATSVRFARIDAPARPPLARASETGLASSAFVYLCPAVREDKIAPYGDEAFED